MALLGVEEGRKSIAGEIDPPYNLDTLIELFELSSTLRPNVDAYATNIDGFGHRFEPAIELDAPDAAERVKDAMWLERIDENSEAPDPTDEQVQDRMRQLRRQARIESSRLRSFFAYCCPDSSFVGLRSITRLDLEVTGNAYWEVLRDRRNMVARLVHVPARTIRLLPLEETLVVDKELVRVSEIRWETITQQRTFRRFVQVDGSKVVAYFRQFGDDRVMSGTSGTYFTDVAALRAAEPDAKSATELLHFRIPSLRSPYGIPRWINNLPAVLGSRQLDEANQAYFDQSAIPPLALLVSGGRLARGVTREIKEFLRDNIKGRKKQHRMLILEAETQRASTGGPSTVPRIQFERLRDVQQQDGTFQLYDGRNIEKISSSFRQPRILTGRDAAINRATAMASLRFAEQQVYQPERQAFDEIVNRQILPELGVMFWSFRSNGVGRMDPEILGALIVDFVEAGVISANEGRLLAAEVFQRGFAMIPATSPQPATESRNGKSHTRAELDRLDDLDRRGEASTPPVAPIAAPRVRPQVDEDVRPEDGAS